jgi:hypothetical protein
MSQSTQDVFHAADERLKTARFGLSDMSNPERASSGLYNAVVFGRMLTFALQNLRSVVPNFDKWYEPKQVEMRADPLMSFFNDLRTKIEKEAGKHTTSSVYLRSFSPYHDMKRFGRPPPGAGDFFMGDAKGGVGWEILQSDGTKEMYYVQLPPDIGEVKMTLAQAPEQYRGKSAAELVGVYLDHLDTLVREAKAEFA